MTSLCPPFTRRLDTEHQKKRNDNGKILLQHLDVKEGRQNWATFMSTTLLIKIMMINAINKDYDVNIRTTLKRAKSTILFCVQFHVIGTL